MEINRVCLDYGHGGNDLGASYRGNYESRDTIRLGKIISSYLESFGIVVIETRNKDIYVSLSDRCKIGNYYKVDLFVSIHRNAFIAERANGVEAYVYKTTSIKTQDLAEKLVKTLSEFGFKNRGVKDANFFVLKKTSMSAILLEVGFIDSSLDNRIFEEKLEDIGSSIGREIVRYLGIWGR